MQIDKRRLTILGFLLFLAPMCYGQAPNIYISQSGGTVFCNGGTQSTQPPSFFNNSGNWGNGPAQIGAGTTVWVCGTFTDTTPGDTLFGFQGSGKNGSPITLKFDTNATLTNTAYWSSSGAIASNGSSYITVDGGTNGKIQNTANGSALAYQQNSTGVYLQGGNYLTIQNLTVHNMYVHSATNDSNVGNSYSADVMLRGASHGLVTNNKLDNNQDCVFDILDNGGTPNEISLNTISACNWGIGVGANGNYNYTGVSVHDNNVQMGANWDDNSDAFHHNGIHLYTVTSVYPTDQITGALIYNNYFYGDPGANNTTLIFIDTAPGAAFPITNGWTFNNVLAPITHPCNNPCITDAETFGHVLENTIFGTVNTVVTYAMQTTSTNGIIEGNIVSTMYGGIYESSGYLLANSDYNLFYNLDLNTGNAMVYNGRFYGNVPQWSGQTGFDSHSLSTNPNLNLSTFQIQAGSSAIQFVPNLSSYCATVAQLCRDKAGSARPPSGNWDAGAYQLGASAGQPQAPSGLTATVQ